MPVSASQAAHIIPPHSIAATGLQHIATTRVNTPARTVSHTLLSGKLTILCTEVDSARAESCLAHPSPHRCLHATECGVGAMPAATTLTGFAPRPDSPKCCTATT